MAQMDHYMRNEDLVGFRTPHHAFHARLVSAAGERGVALMDRLFDHAERYRVAFGSSPPEFWDQHRAIVDACAEGDAQLAVHRLTEHYCRAASVIFEGLGGDDDPERLRLVLAGIVSSGT